jgi:hypothetical protein
MATLHIFSRYFLTAEVEGNVIPRKQYDLPYFFEEIRFYVVNTHELKSEFDVQVTVHRDNFL